VPRVRLLSTLTYAYDLAMVILATPPIAPLAMNSTNVPANSGLEYLNPIASFNGAKQANLFQKIKEREFSGRLFLQDNKGVESVFYFYFGRLIYATGGWHPVRRWQRMLHRYCPEILQDTETLRQGLLGVAANSAIAWEYQVLSIWAKQQKLTLEQINQIICSSIEEVLFDLTQANQVGFYRQADRLDGFTPLTIIHTEPLIAKVWKQWQVWQQSQLGDRSPNQAPIIRNSQELSQRVIGFNSQLCSQRFNGQYSLRDLSVQLGQDLLTLTRSLMMYVQLGLMDLVTISDCLVPNEIVSAIASVDRPCLKIAYGDENPQVCQRMTATLKRLGHDCITVQDGLQAISLFVEKKPDLICLSSQLLHTDAYMICRALRELPVFQKTPIWIFTNNLGLAERIRAKISGASEIVDRSANTQMIQQLLNKYF
jgi:chemotaxis family two-component system response regulator PixG